VCLPQVLVSLRNGVTVIEVASPLHEVDLLGDAIRQQPKYFVLPDDHVLQVLTVLLRTLSDFMEELGKGRGQGVFLIVSLDDTCL
jgi:hypothetical protein